MEPIRYLSALRRRWWVIVVAVVVATAAAWATTAALGPPKIVHPRTKYAATTQLWSSGALTIGASGIPLIGPDALVIGRHASGGRLDRRPPDARRRRRARARFAGSSVDRSGEWVLGHLRDGRRSEARRRDLHHLLQRADHLSRATEAEEDRSAARARPAADPDTSSSTGRTRPRSLASFGAFPARVRSDGSDPDRDLPTGDPRACRGRARRGEGRPPPAFQPGIAHPVGGVDRPPRGSRPRAGARAVRYEDPLRPGGGRVLRLARARRGAGDLSSTAEEEW